MRPDSSRNFQSVRSRYTSGRSRIGLVLPLTQIDNVAEQPVRRPFDITHLTDHLRSQPMYSTQHQWRAEPTTARRRLSADAQVRALPSQKCQRRRLDAGLDSFRRIENAFCRVFGPKEV